MLKLPDGTVKVLVEGLQRARIQSVTEAETHFMSVVVPVEPESGESPESEALRRAVVAQFEQYVKLNKKIPQENLTSLTGIDDAGRMADTISAHLPLKLEQKQKMIEVTGTAERLERLLSQLESESDLMTKIGRAQVRTQVP